MVNPTHLGTLVVVLRAGSFAGAARELGYTGSAVSQQIAALERELGLALFERDARGIRPTASAQVLAERAGEVMAAHRSFEDEVRALGAGASGQVRLGSFPTASRQLVPAAIAEFIRDHAEVRVEMEEAEPAGLVERLVARELDVALVYEYDLVPTRWPAAAESRALLVEDLVALMPADRAGEGAPVRLAELAERDWVSTSRQSQGAQALRRACAAAGFAPRVRYRSNNYEVVASFVRAGLGVAIIPALAASTIEDVDIVPVEDLGVRRHITALAIGAEGNPALRATLDSLDAAAIRIAGREDGLSLPERLRGDRLRGDRFSGARRR